MPKRITLRESKDKLAYYILPEIDRSEAYGTFETLRIEPHPQSVDNHHIIWRHAEGIRANIHPRVIGVVGPEENLRKRVYQCAVREGTDYARLYGCPFVDETKP